ARRPLRHSQAVHRRRERALPRRRARDRARLPPARLRHARPVRLPGAVHRLHSWAGRCRSPGGTRRPSESARDDPDRPDDRRGGGPPHRARQPLRGARPGARGGAEARRRDRTRGAGCRPRGPRAGARGGRGARGEAVRVAGLASAGEKEAPRSTPMTRNAMDPQRIVVTGMGIVSPAGIGEAPLWSAIVEGRSSLRSVAELAPTFARYGFDPGEYKGYVGAPTIEELDAYASAHDVGLGNGELFAAQPMIAAREALCAAGLDRDGAAVGLSLGSNFGQLGLLEQLVRRRRAGALDDVPPRTPA